MLVIRRVNTKNSDELAGNQQCNSATDYLVLVPVAVADLASWPLSMSQMLQVT